MFCFVGIGVGGGLSYSTGYAPERSEPYGGGQRPGGGGPHPAVAVVRAEDGFLGAAHSSDHRSHRTPGVVLWFLMHACVLCTCTCTLVVVVVVAEEAHNKWRATVPFFLLCVEGSVLAESL